MNEPINHIGLSGGKDSTALWGWAINESGYPPETIRGSFCDTENEYQEVYDQIKALDEYGQKRGIAPVTTLRSMGFLNLAILKGRFPSARARFCTERLKMEPTRHHIQYLEWLCGYTVTAHSGVRAAESDERALLDEYDFDDYLKVPVRRPLLKWSISDVWHAHQRYGLPINPIYLQGRRRVGCRLCCMSSKQDVRLTVKHKPWVIPLYREWESIVGGTRVKRGIHCDYSSFFPINAVPLSQRSRTITTKSGEQMKVATIDDVARWSQTLRGGTQGGFDFMFEEDNDFDQGLTCKSMMGNCE